MRGRPDARLLAILCGGAIALLGLAYAGVTLAGLASLTSPEAPIGDPWFSAMEVLILLLAPAMLGLIAAIHAMAAPGMRRTSAAAMACMALAACITCGVHLAILMTGHDPFAGPGRQPFVWPSTSYVLDILAWDGFFALSLLLAARAFNSERMERPIRLLLAAGGALALAGWAGPVTGDMRLRAIGILGYAGLFPIAAGLIAFALLRPLGTER